LEHPKNKVIHRRQVLIGMNIPDNGDPRVCTVSDQEMAPVTKKAWQPGSFFCDLMP
jgi:hypothetical protein